MGSTRPDPTAQRQTTPPPGTNQRRRGRRGFPNIGLLLFVGFALFRCLGDQLPEGGTPQSPTPDVVREQEPVETVESIETGDDFTEAGPGSVITTDYAAELVECAPLGESGVISVSVTNTGAETSGYRVFVNLLADALNDRATVEVPVDPIPPGDTIVSTVGYEDYREAWLFYQCGLGEVIPEP